MNQFLKLLTNSPTTMKRTRKTAPFKFIMKALTARPKKKRRG